MHSIRVILKIHVDGIQTFFRNMFGFLCTSEIMSPHITYLMSHVMPVIKAHAAETAATMNVQEEEDSSWWFDQLRFRRVGCSNVSKYFCPRQEWSCLHPRLSSLTTLCHLIHVVCRFLNPCQNCFVF